MALLAGLVGWAVPAQAVGPLACGQLVTTSVTLTADIGPCDNEGLVVGANGITIDLAGHTIRGRSLVGGAIDQVGIRSVDHTAVTVRNGTVRDFYVGILFLGGSGNTVTRMTVTHNVGTGRTRYGDGILLDGSTNNTIMANVVTANGPDAGIEMVNNANYNHVSYNQVTDNAVFNSFGEDGPGQFTSGISNDAGASFNVIDHNSVRANGAFGISLAGRFTTHDQAIANDIRNNGNWGINAGGDGHTVARNTIDHNGYEQFLPPGFPFNPGSEGGVVTCGTCFEPGDLNTIQDNVITNNNGPGVSMLYNGSQFLGGTGIYGTFPAQPYTAPRSNLVQRNIVRSNAGDGIYVECDKVYDASFNDSCITDSPPHQGIRVLGNQTSGNGGAGAGTSTWDLHDGNPGCDHNIWSANTFRTFTPACTTAP